MKSFKYLTLFVTANVLAGAFFLGCGTTKNTVPSQAAAIKDIASAAGITDGNATILYNAGFIFPGSLGEATSTTEIVVRTRGKVNIDLADEIVKAVKEEVAARKKAAEAWAAKLRKSTIGQFTEAGISDGNATRIYDAGKDGFQSLDALNKASWRRLKSAGLAEDYASAKALEKAVNEAVEKLGRLEADDKEEQAAKATTASEDAQETADAAQKTADAAQSDAANAKRAAANAKKNADAAQKKAEAAKAAAKEAREASPKKEEDSDPDPASSQQ